MRGKRGKILKNFPSLPPRPHLSFQNFLIFKGSAQVGEEKKRKGGRQKREEDGKGERGAASFFGRGAKTRFHSFERPAFAASRLRKTCCTACTTCTTGITFNGGSESRLLVPVGWAPDDILPGA